MQHTDMLCIHWQWVMMDRVGFVHGLRGALLVALNIKTVELLWTCYVVNILWKVANTYVFVIVFDIDLDCQWHRDG